MFSVTVRDHMMVAHSLPDPFFGPAQGLHGVTYVVEATWFRPGLDEHGVVIDIGAATERLGEVTGALRYRNLDDLEEFAGVVTTTEVVARHVAHRLAEGLDMAPYTALEVTLREHPDAWATYRLELPGS
ncbi:6-carboxytetrahydropterin synthase [Georgenia satyanarayanai]|uniref:6-pyruvoyl trahydropterin synthase family protein n=1 Tax=Georgenia satyanarayanai TaxID=860221 RepID=UPI00203FFF85|nr:6-carboxytetrahydropterin synthase [Georgenia satyanarayanai]MCM3660907.1 6-carboxytetrahydropterin synthase [Georgenia satyanarayanai]